LGVTHILEDSGLESVTGSAERIVRGAGDCLVAAFNGVLEFAEVSVHADGTALNPSRPPGTKEQLPLNPLLSTRSCQMALALRPFESANSICSRKGSQALRAPAELWEGAIGDGEIAPKSGVTSSDGVAGFDGRSGVTSLAGFAGAPRPHPPGGRTAIPAARR